jgi:asparagine synthase (glutamine-hydrolysing)
MVDDLKAYAEARYTDGEFEEPCAAATTTARPSPRRACSTGNCSSSYYPGQARMIPDFWMPNRSWEGCNVTDPSARVLSNYGESGK